MIQRIALQFALNLNYAQSNPEILSPIKRFEPETPEHHESRQGYDSGIVMVESEPNVSLAELLDDLEGIGQEYELVGAIAQERANKGGKSYVMVRFIFEPRHPAEVSAELKKIREDVLLQLQNLASRSLWQAQAFLNPHYERGCKVEGQQAIYITLNNREPLIEPDRSPRLVWQKDALDQRIGDEKVPMRPSYHLRFYDESVHLVENLPSD